MKSEIKTRFKAGEKDFSDWKWQCKNRITTVEELEKLIPLSDSEKEEKNTKRASTARSSHFVDLFPIIRLKIRRKFIKKVGEKEKKEPLNPFHT